MTITEDFMAALQTAEQSGDVGPLLALHADSVNLMNLTEKTWEGQEGAREFWQTYLGNFEQIRSEFTAHREADGLGVMEWIATGRLKGGRDLKYRGVSLITLEGDKVKVFRTYYDSAAFVAPVAEEA
ncbi:nuclear transport factor 2 family protein [Deinococcus koreensis]|uniref:Epoxide hydrolase n=1 Tax=Deinococcus koreensis TaxID=2054903 RepID=A0A2K3UWZ1_9DEIO|nr:nuclear transport factor 2 family protein [Deinococcus koreensis]PNY81053.1 epoxide hydrolase [Deinococcus koreensis]